MQPSNFCVSRTIAAVLTRVVFSQGSEGECCSRENCQKKRRKGNVPWLLADLLVGFAACPLSGVIADNSRINCLIAHGTAPRRFGRMSLILRAKQSLGAHPVCRA